jgi:hypothetical protein
MDSILLLSQDSNSTHWLHEQLLGVANTEVQFRNTVALHTLYLQGIYMDLATPLIIILHASRPHGLSLSEINGFGHR